MGCFFFLIRSITASDKSRPAKSDFAIVLRRKKPSWTAQLVTTECPTSTVSADVRPVANAPSALVLIKETEGTKNFSKSSSQNFSLSRGGVNGCSVNMMFLSSDLAPIKPSPSKPKKCTHSCSYPLQSSTRPPLEYIERTDIPSIGILSEPEPTMARFLRPLPILTSILLALLVRVLLVVDLLTVPLLPLELGS